MKKDEMLAAIIELLCSHYPAGVRAISGDTTPPDLDDWEELIQSVSPSQGESVHVQCDQSPDGHVLTLIGQAEKIMNIVNKHGGWPRIVEAVKRYRVGSPTDWGLFVRYMEVLNCPVRSGLSDYYTVERICQDYHVDRKTVLARRTMVPSLIAYDVVFGAQLMLDSMLIPVSVP